ncbi:MAG: hypothetical protein CMJ84_05145 [Planctomycetes bacterium]|jgi:hypothetical protein|nr:hypothetical protein [Planctomycetota bacterium]
MASDGLMTRPTLHGNNVYAIVEECERGRIVLFTERVLDERVEHTDVYFSDVIAHWFDHVLPGNILAGVEDWDLGQFLQHEWERFERGRKHGWPPLEFETRGELLSALEEDRYKAFNVHGSYGLGGWVVARCVHLERRARRWPGLGR